MRTEPHLRAYNALLSVEGGTLRVHNSNWQHCLLLERCYKKAPKVDYVLDESGAPEVDRLGGIKSFP
ncbi:hypothetical protein ACLOJK_004751 [Asimina triloba]